MSPHHLDGHMSIHAVEGRLGVTLPAEAVEVSVGELIVHDYAISHQVEVLEESAFLAYDFMTRRDKGKTLCTGGRSVMMLLGSQRFVLSASLA
jgi:hypothetical protein